MDTERENLKFFLSQTLECYDYFDKWLYPKESEILEFDGIPLKKSLYCDLFDTFLKHNQEKHQDPEIIAHNCIGCNFEEGARTIHYFLKTNKECLSVQYYLNLYSLLFYTHSERLAVIYKEIGFTQKNKTEFDWAAFPNLKMIKYWANFFKHPKAYMFLHHPDFYIDSDPEKPNFIITQVIDNNFVKEFYRAGADNNALRKLLENKENVKIFFPDLIETTKKLCKEFESIISVINSDKNFIDQLNHYTTIEPSLTIDPKAIG